MIKKTEKDNMNQSMQYCFNFASCWVFE